MDGLVFCGFRSNRSWNVVPHVMVLLHVSRQFRMATLESEVWLDFGFDVRRLIHAPDFTEYPTYLTARHHPVNKHLSVLFDDDNIVRRFAKKTEWAFPPDCLPLALDICRRIPSFAQTAQKLWICGESTHNFTLKQPLPIFPNVIELGLLGSFPLFPFILLTRITEAFPNIQHLFLAVFLAHPLGSRCIESLHNLETFELMIENGNIENEAFPRSETLWGCLLPRASASTLTTLRIYGLGGSIARDFSLTSFIHLQHLKFTDGFEFGLDRVLASVPSKLVSFELQIHSDDRHQQPISFSHPYLSCLETLTFEVVRKCRLDDDERYSVHTNRCENLLDDMTRTLTTVQTFTMDLVTLWFSSCAFLVRLRQLRTLTWIQDDARFLTFMNQEFLLKLFDDWPVKPRVTVLTHGELEEEGSWKRQARWPLHSSYYSRLAGRWPSHISALPVQVDSG